MPSIRLVPHPLSRSLTAAPVEAEEVNPETAAALERARASPGAPGSPFCWANLGSLRENGVVEIESESAARDGELKMFGGRAQTFLCPG